MRCLVLVATLAACPKQAPPAPPQPIDAERWYGATVHVGATGVEVVPAWPCDEGTCAGQPLKFGGVAYAQATLVDLADAPQLTVWPPQPEAEPARLPDGAALPVLMVVTDRDGGPGELALFSLPDARPILSLTVHEWTSSRRERTTPRLILVAETGTHPAIEVLGFEQRYEVYEPPEDGGEERLLVASGRPADLPVVKYVWNDDRYVAVEGVEPPVR